MPPRWRLALLLICVISCSPGAPIADSQSRPWYDPFFAEEMEVFLERCLVESGHVMGTRVGHWRGSSIFPTASSEEQSEAWFNAFQRCFDEWQEEGVRPPDYDEAIYREMYTLYMWTHQCMIDNGFPTSPPPSEDLWVEEKLAPRLSWHPYDAVDGAFEVLVPGVEHSPESLARAAEVARIAEICPAAHHEIVAQMATDS